MNINVDPKKLNNFAAFVGDFSKNINTECYEIGSASSRLDPNMEDEDLATMQILARQVSRILEDSEQALSELQQRVEEYADFVTRMKSTAHDS